jgi:hypothetical protein
MPVYPGALIRPGYFHGLQGKPEHWSVRVTGNYRVTFGWSGENAFTENGREHQLHSIVKTDSLTVKLRGFQRRSCANLSGLAHLSGRE